MAKSFLKLDTRRAKKDGKYPIVIAVGHGKNLYLSTGISALPEEWDDRAQLYTGHGARAINSVLGTIKSKVTMRILDLRESGVFDRLDNKQLKAMLQDPDAEVPPKDAPPSLAEVFAAAMKVKSAGNVRLYESTILRLKRYCDIDRVTFGDINKRWLDGFVVSMSDLAPNTKSIHLRNLRAINNYAIDCEITTNYAFRRYKMPTPTTRKKAFSPEVIRNIATLPLAHSRVFRDIFMLTFFLIGINFGDLCGLKSITNGRVEYSRMKTHKPYSIKVEPETLEIIERLKGKGQLLMMLDEVPTYRRYYYRLSAGLARVRDVYNRIHPDAQIAELTTYWARHSWATIAASLDIPKETIAAALGHGGNTVTDIYIDFDRRKVDEANRRVIDWVLYAKK